MAQIELTNEEILAMMNLINFFQGRRLDFELLIPAYKKLEEKYQPPKPPENQIPVKVIENKPKEKGDKK